MSSSYHPVFDMKKESISIDNFGRKWKKMFQYDQRLFTNSGLYNHEDFLKESQRCFKVC